MPANNAPSPCRLTTHRHRPPQQRTVTVPADNAPSPSPPIAERAHISRMPGRRRFSREIEPRARLGPIEPQRTVTVPIPQRTVTVPVRQRTVTVPANNAPSPCRLTTHRHRPPQQRTVTVPVQQRTVTVSAHRGTGPHFENARPTSILPGDRTESPSRPDRTTTHRHRPVRQRTVTGLANNAPSTLVYQRTVTVPVRRTTHRHRSCQNKNAPSPPVFNSFPTRWTDCGTCGARVLGVWSGWFAPVRRFGGRSEEFRCFFHGSSHFRGGISEVHRCIAIKLPHGAVDSP